MSTWSVAPRDQGQIVEHAWAGAGNEGAIRRVTDRSDRTVSYYLHRWTDQEGDFQPWSDCPIEAEIVERDGRSITEDEAKRLLDDA